MTLVKNVCQKTHAGKWQASSKVYEWATGKDVENGSEDEAWGVLALFCGIRYILDTSYFPSYTTFENER